MKRMFQNTRSAKTLLIFVLLSFSTMLMAFEKEHFKFYDGGAGFNGDLDISSAFRLGKDYIINANGFTFGLERTIDFEMLYNEDILSLHSNLMLGPVIGWRFDEFAFSLARTWGVGPAFYLDNKIDDKKLDFLLFSNTWDLRFQILLREESSSVDVHFFRSKPIPSQKATYGIYIGFTFNNFL